jgi:hypothetical protein
MVCRTTRIGSAVTSFARLHSGLEDQQCLSTYHELLRDGRDARTPTAAEQTVLIDSLVTATRRADGLTRARRDSLLRRLEEARNAAMDGRTYYAAAHLVARTERARQALDVHYDNAARTLGWSRSRVAAYVDEQRGHAENDRVLTAPAEWRREFASRAENTGLPMDRSTAYAMRRLDQRQAAARTSAPSRPGVAHQPVQSSAIRSLGYDPDTGRLEVALHSRPDQPYAYRVPREVYAQMRSAASLGSFYAREIRRNPDYQYDTQPDADSAGTLSQCGTCGQFADAGHTCPVRDSDEERNRTARLARERSRASRATAPTAPTAPTAEPTAEPAGTEPRRLGYAAQRRYAGDSGAFRTHALTGLRQEARQHASVSVPVNALINRTGDTATDQAGFGRVNGRARIDYLGRGQGYTVSAVVGDGDSGGDRLRCNCPQYQANYDCPHVRQTVADLQARINADRLRTPHRLTAEQTEAAHAQVAADLARDRAESLQAQQTAQATWGEPEVTYADDMAAFQRDYTAAKQRLDRGEEPIDYQTENATDGLGARGTGRAFGVEIEFDFTSGTNRSTALAAIGRDLHAAGLTSSAAQRGYHAGMSRGYTENHQGGWSFEADCTVAGEIVSPIMYDEPQTWQNLQTVCDIVRRHGGEASVRAGSHVHVSAHNYDHTVENHNRLMATFRENEDLVYRLSTNPSRGTHRGPSWCAPNQVPASGYSDVREATRRNGGHHMGVNMQSVTGRQSDHVEFRTWDATLNPAVIQTQIKVSLAMTEAAFRDRDHQPTAAAPLGSHRAHNRQEHGTSRRLTGQAWEQDTAGFRRFADRLFRRQADKAQVAGLFAATKWQRSR